jgi:hypothetical protein
MNTTQGLKEGRTTHLLASLGAAASQLWERLLAPKPHPDPDLDQIFSDSVEREMMNRELHCR